MVTDKKPAQPPTLQNSNKCISVIPNCATCLFMRGIILLLISLEKWALRIKMTYFIASDIF